MNPATRTPARMPRPPSWGVGTACRDRSTGLAIAPRLIANRLVSGTSSSASSPATRKARSASVLVGIAVEPEGKRHQAPDLAAEVLLAGAVAVEDRGHGGGVEQPLAGDGRRRQHLPRKGLQRASQPGGDRDREALLATVDDLP